MKQIYARARESLGTLRNLVWSHEEQPIFVLPLAGIELGDAPRIMRRNDHHDLAKYRQAESWQSDRHEFLERAKNRLEAGQHVYTFAPEDQLLHYGWLMQSPPEFAYPEVQRLRPLGPHETGVLYDFYTLPDARGRGLYQSGVREMLCDLSEDSQIKEAYVSVGPENHASRHVIEKAGFDYCGSIVHRRVFGFRTRRLEST